MAGSPVAACVWESSWDLGWGSWSPVLPGLLASPMLTQPLLTRARRVPSTRWCEIQHHKVCTLSPPGEGGPGA